MDDINSFKFESMTVKSGSYSQRCGTTRVLGGPNIVKPSSVISKSFSNLKPHYKVILTFTYIKYGVWRNNSAIIQVDDKLYPQLELTGLSSEGGLENSINCEMDPTSEPSKVDGGTIE